MYEPKSQPLLSRAHFLRRWLAHGAVAVALLALSMLLGMAGYIAFEQLPWVDAFLNAAMLLGGMGPVDPPRSEAGKLFAGLYALYAGLVFLVAVALIFTPLLHRVMHRFHLDQGG